MDILEAICYNLPPVNPFLLELNTCSEIKLFAWSH